MKTVLKKTLAAGAIAIAFVAGGATWAIAATPDPNGRVQACYRLDDGSLRVRDPGNTVGKCNGKVEKPLSWAQDPSALTIGLETTKSTFNVPPGQFAHVVMVCPTGKLAVAGGYATLNPAMSVTQNMPLGGKWAIEVFNGDAVAHTADGYAQCIKAR